MERVSWRRPSIVLFATDLDWDCIASVALATPSGLWQPFLRLALSSASAVARADEVIDMTCSDARRYVFRRAGRGCGAAPATRGHSR